jgi:hypothetical protein
MQATSWLKRASAWQMRFNQTRCQSLPELLSSKRRGHLEPSHLSWIEARIFQQYI